MKKITFVLALLSFGAQAQTFPNPYCDIDATGVTVEEITSVSFAGTSITNTNDELVLIDQTASIAAISLDGTYTIEVSGDTKGEFYTDIVAFIDWNQNDVLDDAGEIYDIGTLFDTDGADGVSVTMDITVPSDAVLGNTRIRITKIYQDEDSPAIINPCAIEFNPFGIGNYPGYGQALDFSLLIEVASNAFPSPYCDIDATGVTVEEITAVSFAGTSISNTNDTSVLVDQTAVVVNVAPNEAYSIEVAGDTKGEFYTDIVAFIDWNQNDILDDAGEIYEIGTLFDTDGADGTSVTMDITVPSDAVIGNTRIRITKTYQDEDSPAIINPCAIEFNPFGIGNFPGYGQALDFTLNLAPLSVENFEIHALSVYPVPTKDVLNIKYKTGLQDVKIYNLLGQEVYAKNTRASHLQVDLSSFKTGVYIVKLQTEDGQHSLRIMKQ